MKTPIYRLDGDGCVLCQECAEESETDFVPHFRALPREYTNSDDAELRCDECSELIPSTEEAPSA